MHLYVMARAQIDRLKRWEDELNRKFMPYIYGHNHPELQNQGIKTDVTGLYQLNIRPIRFYEIAFPEPMIDQVLPMIAPGKAWSKRYDPMIWGIRKALGLEKIPEFKPQIKEELKTPGEWLDRNWVDCTGIGIKKDKYENGIEML